MKLGVTYSSDLGPGLAAVGSPGTAADAANYAREQQALWQRGADDINSRGGFGGCKVVVVFHDFHVLNTSGFSSESQAECADLAEDKRVFGVVSAVLENETAVRCFADHRVVSLFYSAVYQPTPADFAKYRGYLYQPSGMTPYRFGPFIDQLAAADFLPRGAKVGILLADDGSGTNQYLVERLWKPRLAARGITPVVFNYKLVQSVSDNSSIAAQFGSAVLRFKSANVDRILVTPDNGDATIFFTQVAESQGYRPRYALNSATAPAGWPSVPAGQRRDALNVSFSLIDLGGAPDGHELASNPPSSGRARCEALYKGHTGSTTIIAAYNICDAFEFLRTALQNTTVVTPAALLAGVDRMVSSLSLANGYANATFRAPSRYDGASATRMMRWDEAATRWHYVSAPTLVS